MRFVRFGLIAMFAFVWVANDSYAQTPLGLFRGGTDAAQVGRCDPNRMPGFCKTGVELVLKEDGARLIATGRFGHGDELYNAMVTGKPYTGDWNTSGGEITFSVPVSRSGDELTIEVGGGRTLILNVNGRELVGKIRYVSTGTGNRVTDTPYTLRLVNQ
jgi:hypothetical protein